MCEAYFNHLCRQAGQTGAEAVSAGVCADGNEAMSASAAAIMAEFGIDCRSFRTRQLTSAILDTADRIVVMGASHVRQIGLMAPDMLDKTRLLLEYADCGRRDVADPFGGSVEVYRRCFQEMKPALDNLFLEINRTMHQ